MSCPPPNDKLVLSPPRTKPQERYLEDIASLRDFWKDPGVHHFYLDTELNRFVYAKSGWFGKTELKYDDWWKFHLIKAVEQERRGNPRGFSEEQYNSIMDKINRCKGPSRRSTRSIIDQYCTRC